MKTWWPGGLLIPVLAYAPDAAAAQFAVLSRTTLFTPPLADQRAPELRIETQLTSPLVEFIGALGGRLPVLTVDFGIDKLQVGADAAVFSSLRRPTHEPAPRFLVLSADYLLAVFIAWQHERLSSELVIAHMSAHLQDGMNRPMDERYQYSREFVQMRFAYRFGGDRFHGRAYIGGGTLVHTTPALKPLSVGGGFEAYGPRFAASPYAAVDVTYYQDVHSTDVSAQLGVAFEPQLPIVKLRLALVGYSGSDRRGQFLGGRDERFSLGLFGRFGEGPS